MTLTPDVRGHCQGQPDAAPVNIYATCVSNVNTDQILSRVYDGTVTAGGGDCLRGFGRRRPATAGRGQARRCPPRNPHQYQNQRQNDGRVTAGETIRYLVCEEPSGGRRGPKIGQRCRTSRVVDRGGDFSRFFAVSRAEELAAEAAARKELGLGPPPSERSAKDLDGRPGIGPMRRVQIPGPTTNTFEQPRMNSTRETASIIQMAIQDLANLPEKVEKVVSMTMQEPGVKKKLLQMVCLPNFDRFLIFHKNSRI